MPTEVEEHDTKNLNLFSLKALITSGLSVMPKKDASSDLQKQNEVQW